MSWADASRNLEELIFDGVTRALEACRLSMRDIDSVVLASHDLVDGRSLSSMVTAPAAGAYMRDEIRVVEDGLVALSLAAARVAAGESRLSVVVAWGRASEGDMVNAPRACMDPAYEQAFGLTEHGLSAMRLSRWLGEHGPKQAERERAARVRQERAQRNPDAVSAHTPSPSLPLPFPLHDFDAPRPADIVAAAVVGSAPAAWLLAGIGHGTDETWLGERDWVARPALKSAADRALQQAGVGMDQVDLFEIDGMTLADEALTLESLGLAPAGKGFDVLASSDHINASGGSAAGWCYPAMGLVRLSECLNRLGGNARRAMAVGSSPIGAQTQVAAIVEVA